MIASLPSDAYLSAEDTDPIPPHQHDLIKQKPGFEPLKVDVINLETMQPALNKLRDAAAWEKELVKSGNSSSGEERPRAGSKEEKEASPSPSQAGDQAGYPGQELRQDDNFSVDENGVQVRKLFQGRKWFQNLNSSRVQQAVNMVLDKAQDEMPHPQHDQLGPSVAELERKFADVPGAAAELGLLTGAGGAAPSKRWGASKRSTEAIMQRLSSAVPQM